MFAAVFGLARPLVGATVTNDPWRGFRKAVELAEGQRAQLQRIAAENWRLYTIMAFEAQQRAADRATAIQIQQLIGAQQAELQRRRYLLKRQEEKDLQDRAEREAAALQAAEAEQLRLALKKEGLTPHDLETFTCIELKGEAGPQFYVVTMADYKRTQKKLREEFNGRLRRWAEARNAVEKAGREFSEPRPKPLYNFHGRFSDEDAAEKCKKALERAWAEKNAQ